MIWLLSLFTSLQICTSNVHPIHVSMTEVTYNNSSDKIELSVRIFTDDLQKAVGLTPNGELPKNYPGAEALIEDYIIKNIALFDTDGQSIPMQYSEAIASGDAIWIYLQADNIKSISDLKMINSVLHDIFDDQTNMVKVTGKNKATFVMNKKVQEIKFNL